MQCSIHSHVMCRHQCHDNTVSTRRSARSRSIRSIMHPHACVSAVSEGCSSATSGRGTPRGQPPAGAPAGCRTAASPSLCDRSPRLLRRAVGRHPGSVTACHCTRNPVAPCSAPPLAPLLLMQGFVWAAGSWECQRSSRSREGGRKASYFVHEFHRIHFRMLENNFCNAQYLIFDI